MSQTSATARRKIAAGIGTYHFGPTIPLLPEETEKQMQDLSSHLRE